MEENKINALMDMTVSKIRQLVDADTIIGKPISTPDGITVIPVSRMSFGIGTGGTTGSKGISFTGGNGAGVYDALFARAGWLLRHQGRDLPHDQREFQPALDDGPRCGDDARRARPHRQHRK